MTPQRALRLWYRGWVVVPALGATWLAQRQGYANIARKTLPEITADIDHALEKSGNR